MWLGEEVLTKIDVNLQCMPQSLKYFSRRLYALDDDMWAGITHKLMIALARRCTLSEDYSEGGTDPRGGGTSLFFGRYVLRRF